MSDVKDNDPRRAAMAVIWQRLCADEAVNDGAKVVLGAQDPAPVMQSMAADGSWADVNYACENLKDWDAAKHLERLGVMARAWYAAQGTAAQGNAANGNAGETPAALAAKMAATRRCDCPDIVAPATLTCRG